VGALTLARMVAGLGAAMTFITSRAVVADLTPRDQLQRSVAQITMIMLVGQMTAPILGNFVIAAGGWRAIQLSQFLVGLVLVALVWRRITETLPEQTRAVAQGAAGFAGLLQPSVALLRRPRFLLLMAQVGLLYSAYPAFVTLAPHLMIEAFHRPMTEYSYYFTCLPLGYFLGNWAVLRFGLQLGQHRLVLLGSAFGALSALVSLLLLANGVWHPLALFLPAGTFLNLGMGLALPSVSARAVGESWPSTASGWGLVGFAQQLIAAISVQMLAFFPSASPFPVVAVCLGLTLVTFLMECLPQIANPAPAATHAP
jgi:DHA1 family bicyclomycin/chloramphenicol resistance-like MFS transporter